MDMGFSARQTLALLVAYGGACAMLGLALENIPEYLSLACYVLLFLGHCLFVIRAEAIGQRLGRYLPNNQALPEEWCEPN
jgi:UDP-GlcNAc:undecaprenyl-phosphate GlcNAc-1-phosphate transferase